MENLRELVAEVLDKGFLMSLATMDEGGLWVSDVIFVHDEKLNIYWFSDSGVRHSRAIQKHPQVAATITSSENPNIGIQISGVAEKIEGDVFPMAVKHRKKRGKPPPSREGEILEPGESWYVLRPKKIDIINEPLFGYDKRTIQLA